SSLAGTIAVPINVQSTAHEVAKLLKDCTPKGFVAEANKIAALSHGLFEESKLRLIVGASALGWQEYESAVGTADPISEPLSNPRDPCLIIYSSGTTGEPKGIVLRQECLIENAKRVIERL